MDPATAAAAAGKLATLTALIGRLLDCLRKKCNKLTMKIVEERLKGTEQQIYQIAIELEVSKRDLKNIEGDIISATGKKLAALKVQKKSAERQRRKVDEKLEKLYREKSDVLSEKLIIAAMPCN